MILAWASPFNLSIYSFIRFFIYSFTHLCRNNNGLLSWFRDKIDKLLSLIIYLF